MWLKPVLLYFYCPSDKGPVAQVSDYVKTIEIPKGITFKLLSKNLLSCSTFDICITVLGCLPNPFNNLFKFWTVAIKYDFFSALSTPLVINFFKEWYILASANNPSETVFLIT